MRRRKKRESETERESAAAATAASGGTSTEVAHTYTHTDGRTDVCYLQPDVSNITSCNNRAETEESGSEHTLAVIGLNINNIHLAECKMSAS